MKNSEEIKAKIAALDRGYDEQEFGDELRKAINHTYYLEDRDSHEGELQGAAGYEDEEKAIDHLLEADSKYGSWWLWKWTGKAWLFCKLKRKGRSIEIKWIPSADGPFA